MIREVPFCPYLDSPPDFSFGKNGENCLDAVHDDIGDHGRRHADDHVGQRGTDGAPGGQFCAVLGVCRDGGSQGAVGDVDGSRAATV